MGKEPENNDQWSVGHYQTIPEREDFLFSPFYPPPFLGGDRNKHVKLRLKFITI